MGKTACWEGWGFRGGGGGFCPFLWPRHSNWPSKSTHPSKLRRLGQKKKAHFGVFGEGWGQGSVDKTHTPPTHTHFRGAGGLGQQDPLAAST